MVYRNSSTQRVEISSNVYGGVLATKNENKKIMNLNTSSNGNGNIMDGGKVIVKAMSKYEINL